MNQVIMLLEACRTNRRLSRTARTVCRACKRIRNEPAFSNWQFTLLAQDPQIDTPSQDYLIGFAASPKWAEHTSSRLIIMARRLTLPHGRRHPGAVEYVIKELQSPASAKIPPNIKEPYELIFGAQIEPIRLAGSFIAIAKVWEQELYDRIPTSPPPPADSPPPSPPIGTSLADDGIPYELEYLKQIPLGLPANATLADYEYCLNELLPEIGFLGRVEISEARYNRLIDLVSEELATASSPLQRGRRLARDYSSAMAYALVQLAADEYQTGEVWPVIASRLGEQDLTVVRELGVALETCQRRHGLTECHAPRRLRYVTQMLFQAGIPDSCMEQFIDLVFDRFVRRGEVTPRVVLRGLRQEMRDPYWRDDQYQVPEPIVDFLDFGGGWAEQWVVVTVAYLGSPGYVQDLMGVAPSRLVEGLKRWSKKPTTRIPRPERRKDGAAKKVKVAEARRANIQTCLDVVGKALVLRMGEQVLVGDFCSEAWLHAILRDLDGTTIAGVPLEARRLKGGVVIEPTTVELPTYGGSLRLDIEFGGDVLESYEVPSFSSNEICQIFTGSGRPVSSDILRKTNAWLLLPAKAVVSPKDAVKFRETFQTEPTYDLAWLDLRECEWQALVVESENGQRQFAVRVDLQDEEYELRGGNQVLGAFTKGRPIYAGVLPEVRFLNPIDNEPSYVPPRLTIAVEMLDDGTILAFEPSDMLEAFLGDGGWADLNLLLEYLDVLPQRPLLLSFEWRDAWNLPRDLGIASIPEFLVDFAEPVFVPQRTEMAKVDVITTPGWVFRLAGGATVVDKYDDVVELTLDLNATAIFGYLETGDLRLPISIESPIAKWRLESSKGVGPKHWVTSIQTIWLDEIIGEEYRYLVVMVTSPFIYSVGLRAGEFRVNRSLGPGEMVTTLDLGNLPEIARREGRKTPLYLSFYDRRADEVATIQVAELYDKWVPDNAQVDIMATCHGQKLHLTWGGVVPRHPMIASLRPAWDLAHPGYEAAIEAGASGCIFDTDEIGLGPYHMEIMDERDALWGSDSDVQEIAARSVVWISDGSPQVRDLSAQEKGDTLRCASVVSHSDIATSWVGVVLRDGEMPAIEEVIPQETGPGQLGFVANNAKKDISMAGLYLPGDKLAYRFIAVGRSALTRESISRLTARHWYDLVASMDKGVSMWIAEQNVRPIPVPHYVAEQILAALASEEAKVSLRFSLSTPSYAGPVDMAANEYDEQEFSFSFKTTLVECIDDNCPHRAGVIPQETWYRHHHPICKVFRSHMKEIRANLIMEYDVMSLLHEISKWEVSTDYLDIVADSSFRPLLDHAITTEVGLSSEALIRAYKDLGKELSHRIRVRKESKT